MDQIRQWLEQPDTMGAEAVSRLPELIAQYPYCAAYRLLYVIALANVHSTQMPDELRRTAVWLPDRLRLFLLVNRGEHEWVRLMEQLERTKRETGREENDFELIERFLEQASIEGEDLTIAPDAAPDAGRMPDGIPTAAALAYNLEAEPAEYDLSGITDDAETDFATAAGEPDETDSLIDSFLQAEAEGHLFVPPAPEPERNDESEVPLRLETIRESAFLTESLAKIYIKQHKYEQALTIIRGLNLKYPKKNAYFADQIRFLETVLHYQQGATAGGDGNPDSGNH